MKILYLIVGILISAIVFLGVEYGQKEAPKVQVASYEPSLNKQLNNIIVNGSLPTNKIDLSKRGIHYFKICGREEAGFGSMFYLSVLTDYNGNYWYEGWYKLTRVTPDTASKICRFFDKHENDVFL